MAKTCLKQRLFDDKNDVFWMGSASGILVAAGQGFTGLKLRSSFGRTRGQLDVQGPGLAVQRVICTSMRAGITVQKALCTSKGCQGVGGFEHQSATDRGLQWPQRSWESEEACKGHSANREWNANDEKTMIKNWSRCNNENWNVQWHQTTIK